MRATQFQEFAEAITASLTVGSEVHVPDARIQPIAARDVTAEVAEVAAGAPLNGIINIGGPDKITFADMARTVLAKQSDDKALVVIDPAATYFGTAVDADSLVTGDNAKLAATKFA